ncbi:methyltransferase domain-containing protein [Nocardioides guangzhouensis]|uniref:Methyltransferase domain-containing protein n=1 Tax=Nocardioides guangzhouensis TaxID=2497878 RepID=A0A4Q4Z4T9_9ACTN|nr:methyltransferase domain-containing protein [Nocardioides guangzhouensis]RYP82757.1 methyltransferase domain-containing protein [Nocardioides guangzhouensis]
MNPPDDVYTHGHAESVLRSHRWRTAENSAAYLLPRLHEDARVLDVGCGPGTITVDLARIVAAGSVVGIDRSEEVVDEARATARRAGVTNVELRVGDVYALDHDDASFDVVHAHQVLQHLSDPVAALREMGRVCTPEGLVAVRDSDYAAFTWWPAVPELDAWLDLYRAVARGNDAEPDAGRQLKGWALAAGLEVVSSTAGTWCFSTPEDVAWWGGMWADRIVASAMADQARERGLATDEELQRLAEGWRRWAGSSYAWFVVLHGELLCSPAGVQAPTDANGATTRR